MPDDKLAAIPLGRRRFGRRHRLRSCELAPPTGRASRKLARGVDVRSDAWLAGPRYGRCTGGQLRARTIDIYCSMTIIIRDWLSHRLTDGDCIDDKARCERDHEAVAVRVLREDRVSDLERLRAVVATIAACTEPWAEVSRRVAALSSAPLPWQRALAVEAPLRLSKVQSAVLQPPSWLKTARSMVSLKNVAVAAAGQLELRHEIRPQQ